MCMKCRCIPMQKITSCYNNTAFHICLHCTTSPIDTAWCSYRWGGETKQKSFTILLYTQHIGPMYTDVFQKVPQGGKLKGQGQWRDRSIPKEIEKHSRVLAFTSCAFYSFTLSVSNTHNLAMCDNCYAQDSKCRG